MGARIVPEPAALLSARAADYMLGPLGPFLSSRGDETGLQHERLLVFAAYRLQDLPDYRAAIRGWFEGLDPGGLLVITVPHAFLYERQAMLPSQRQPRQKRLYTPASLATEIEEALAPNSYRVRWLGDLDDGYDYRLAPDRAPVGRHDVAAVIERIAVPAWALDADEAGTSDRPSFAFEPERTRIEHVVAQPHRRILVLKLDHLGDFVMSLPAQRRLRALFPQAEITLVVGPWNEQLARETGLYDHVLPFAAYPRNSSEEAVDVHGRKALFDALVTDDYDLAIDLRTDPDTRFFLRDVRARMRAGMGTRAEFPFLDIFLPVDVTRHHHETAWEDRVPLHQFHAQGYCCRRTHFLIECKGDLARPDRGAIVWGPYRHLDPGRYLFQPFLEVDHETPGLLGCDVALDAERVAFEVLSAPEDISLRFEVRTRASFEFRFQMVDEEPMPDFRFYGGRLVKEGASGVLHQSEYLRLLVELIAMRMAAPGSLREIGAHP